jgi:hypothetical protein
MRLLVSRPVPSRPRDRATACRLVRPSPRWRPQPPLLLDQVDRVGQSLVLLWAALHHLSSFLPLRAAPERRRTSSENRFQRISRLDPAVLSGKICDVAAPVPSHWVRASGGISRPRLARFYIPWSWHYAWHYRTSDLLARCGICGVYGQHLARGRVGPPVLIMPGRGFRVPPLLCPP